MEFSLRPATEDDLAKILEIEKASHRSPWGEEEFRAELSKPYSQFLVLTDDETDAQIAGYIVFWLMFDECNLLNIVVEQSNRGTGLAKLMLRQMVNVALRKGIKKILLEVRKSNQSAVQLYQKAGFVIIHVRKKFYSDGEDAYQMALYLDAPQPVEV